MISRQKRSPASKWIVFGCVCAGVLLTQLLTFILVVRAIPDWPARGQLGDLFGITNSLFSGIAFAGIVFTILLQQEQISMQREEATHEREEARRSLDSQSRANHLSMLTFLISHYDRRLANLEGKYADGPGGAALARLRESTVARRGELEKVISELHDDAVGYFRRD